MTNTALALRAKPEDLARVETIIAEFTAAGGSGDSGHFGRAFRMAAAIRALHNAISEEMMKEIMHLQGTGLGFLTDKDKDGGYDAKIVKLVAIEASLMGAYWVGNEFNIISERPYLTKNFFTRKLREFPGLTDLKLSPGVPVMSGDKGALVPYVATWKLNGQEMRIERLLTKLDDNRDLDERICVKVNSGMGADAILGKAERKIKAQIYARLTGSDLTDGDIDDVVERPKPVRGLDDLAQRLERKAEGNGSSQPEASATSAASQADQATGEESGLIEEAQFAFDASQELRHVTKAEEDFRIKAKSEATRQEISVRADKARERIRASRPQRGEIQKELTPQ